MPLEITFCPDNGKIVLDENYYLSANPYYYKLLLNEFDEVLSKGEHSYIVLDSNDTDIIDEKSVGRIIFEADL